MSDNTSHDYEDVADDGDEPGDSRRSQYAQVDKNKKKRTNPAATYSLVDKSDKVCKQYNTLLESFTDYTILWATVEHKKVC